MGRRPCCEKMGMKKGPWSVEEDQILINYIHLNGHPNWRALPNLAGLLRCGKSCRLRWINYLRPDIKRGNFTLEEEETIIKLHQILGNRWSTIASKLPGRTDNEIKNVWHTHLKKRIHQNQDQNDGENSKSIIKSQNSPKQQCSSNNTNISAVTTTTSGTQNEISSNNKDSATSSSEDVIAFIDETFWSEIESTDYNIVEDDENKDKEILDINDDDDDDKYYSKLYNHDTKLWFDLVTTSRIIGDISEF
ncbi:unnamed protein product [Cochlearia groenlandica]